MKDLSDKLNRIRNDYSKKELSLEETGDDPTTFFRTWLHEAIQAEVNEPNAMDLATVSPESGRPSIRIVLLRSADEQGLTFFTNYNSQKGRDLEQHPQACVNFFWPELERQVRISGHVEKLSGRVSDEYFQSRPRESQIGAWTSDQSKEIKDRQELEDRFQAIAHKYEGKDVPRPPHWGGFLLKPEIFEFWQGRENRLHDRIRFSSSGRGWQASRLAP